MTTDLITELHGLPPDTVETLREFAQAAAKGGLAPKTIAALKSDGRIFAGWCRDQGVTWLPATPQTVAGFVAAMAAQGRAPATVQRYLASIALWHSAAELANPCAALLVKMARKAHLRAVNKRQKQAAPLGEAEVSALEERLVLPAADPDARLAALRDRALLRVAHDTLGRASELVALRWEDLAIDPDGDGTVLIRRSKTDQEGEGRVRWIDRATVAALNKWRKAHDAELARRAAAEAARIAALHAQRFPGSRWPQGRTRLNPVREPVPLEWIASPYLFRGLAPHHGAGRSLGWSLQLSPASVSRIIKRRMAEAGFDPRGYSAHSTRVGKLQDLLAEGVDLLGAMDAGGWKSPAMPARYGENILAARGAVARMHKKRRGEEGG
jgi:site-specific recombinase XerD